MDLDTFLVLWACKEAFAKALGQGLAYDLSRVGFAALTKSGRGPFARASSSAAASTAAGASTSRSSTTWHCAAVCRGPPGDGLLPFFAAPGAGRDGGPRGGASWMKVGRPLRFRGFVILDRPMHALSPNDADDDCEATCGSSFLARRVWRRTKSA